MPVGARYQLWGAGRVLLLLAMVRPNEELRSQGGSEHNGQEPAMTMTNTNIIDLDRSELVIDPLSEAELFASQEPALLDQFSGPMVVVSPDRLVSLELILFADLVPQDDVVHVDSPDEIASYFAVSDVQPSLCLVAHGFVEETRRVLGQLGLGAVAVIAI